MVSVVILCLAMGLFAVGQLLLAAVALVVGTLLATVAFS